MKQNYFIFAGLLGLALLAFYAQQNFFSDDSSSLERVRPTLAVATGTNNPPAAAMPSLPATESFTNNAPKTGSPAHSTPHAMPQMVEMHATPASEAAPQAQDMVQVEEKLPLPLVFMELPKDIQLSPEQVAKLESLRQDFMKQTGADNPNVNSSDPAYVQKWARAQASSDDQFRLWYGDSAYMAMTAKRAMQN